MKVRYIGASDEQVAWENDDPRGLLETGDVYEVEVHSWHTRYHLKGIDGRFNAVCFEIVEDDISVAESDGP